LDLNSRQEANRSSRTLISIFRPLSSHGRRFFFLPPPRRFFGTCCSVHSKTMFVQLKRRVTKNSLRQVYFAHAQSHILYSIIIWGGTSHIASVFTAQKRVIRAMAGVRYWKGRTPVTSCKPLYEQFDILPVCSLYILECVKFVKKFPGKFEKNSDIHNYNARNKENLNIQPSSLKLSDQNPTVMMVKLFNSIYKKQ